MWDKIKQWPTSVKLAVAFLTIVWCLFLSMQPVVVIALTVLGLAAISVFRVAIFLMDGR